MNVFVPFTALKIQTLLAATSFDATLVPLSGPHGYSEFFKNRWQDGETFISFEHDVVPTKELLDSLWNCDQPICLTKYDHNDPSIPWHCGCIKISKSFITAHPINWDDVLWHQCDSTLWTAYGGDEKPICRHNKPKLRHLHYGNAI